MEGHQDLPVLHRSYYSAGGHSCLQKIQLKSKGTGAVLMRKIKDYQETILTKLALNNKKHKKNHEN